MKYNDTFIYGIKLSTALTKEESNELLIQIKNGDALALDKFVKHNLRLILYEINKRFDNVEFDKIELFSIGSIGLMKAINSFDLNKNCSFSTYAVRCIDNEILMFLNKEKKYKNIKSLNIANCVLDDYSELSLENIISADIDIEEECRNKENNEKVLNLLKQLSKREREMILMNFGFYGGKTYTQKEIAKIFFISPSRVNRIIKGALKKIKIELLEEDYIETNCEKSLIKK